MRLFYICTFLIFVFVSGGFASTGETLPAPHKVSSIQSICNKSGIHFTADLQKDQESIQKDLLHSNSLKLPSGIFIFLAFLGFVFLKFRLYKRLNAEFRQYHLFDARFKMLYPKHVFW